jgi:hypothetical protein
MKKNIFFIPGILYAVGIIILFGLSGCKKSSIDHTASDNTFSFSYNGSRYSLAPLNYEYSVDSMTIGISRFDIFTAFIYYKKPNCAFYATDNTAVIVAGDCQLTIGPGLPIDSAAVYIYQSGSLNVSYSNCNAVKFTDLSGNHVTATYCDMEGSFELGLKNNENKLITISDGKFVQYHMLRSWLLHW